MISAILVVLVILLFVLNTPKKPKNFPPGPQNLPIYGAFPILRAYGFRDLPKACTELCDVYKTKILGLFLSIFPCVVLNDAALIKEMLYREEFDGRLDTFVVRLRSYWKQLGIFFTDGYFWHTQRRFSLRYMRDYGFGRRSDTLEEVVANEIKEMIDMRVNGPKYPAEYTVVKGELVYIHYFFAAPFMNGLLHILTQTTLPRSEYHLLWELGRNALMFLRNSDDFGGVIALTPSIRHVAPKLSGYKDMRESNQHLIDFFTKIVEEAVATYDESHDRHFLDVYIRKIKGEEKNNEKSTFTLQQLIVTCVDYMLPTSTGVGTVLTQLVERLLLQPEVQDKIHEEIDRVVGRDRLPSIDDRRKLHHKYSDTDADPHNAVRGFFYSHVGWLLVRKHPEVKRRGKLIDLSDIHANPVLRFQKTMPYTEACIREVMRMNVLVPMGVPHRALKATTIGGYDLPENTAIAGNFKALNYDKEIWGDPENFRPERYIEDGKLNPAKDRSLPFGAGHRLCAGETFARQSMFQVFAGFMQAFQVSPADRRPYTKPVTRVNGIITTMPELWVRVKPR